MMPRVKVYEALFDKIRRFDMIKLVNKLMSER